MKTVYLTITQELDSRKKNDPEATVDTTVFTNFKSAKEYIKKAIISYWESEFGVNPDKDLTKLSVNNNYMVQTNKHYVNDIALAAYVQKETVFDNSEEIINKVKNK